MPVSALVALKAWIATGTLDTIHPAASVVLLMIIGISLLYKRTFCSWICPLGSLSEGLALLGQKLFKQNFQLPKWLDYPLRSLKYFLLFFILKVVLLGLSGNDAQNFLQTPYNMIADVKMLQFFLNISLRGIIVIGVLVIGSIFIQNFWCRYICPYGALLGILSFLSPFKIKRNKETCIGCAQCAAVCPNQISLEQLKTVQSVECTGCLNCVNICPVKGALQFKLLGTRLSLSPLILGIILIVTWLSIVSLAKLTGHWDSIISPAMYKDLIPISFEILNGLH